MTDMTPELERKNLVLGWALFAIFVLLFAGTFADRRSSTSGSSTDDLPGPAGIARRRGSGWR